MLAALLARPAIGLLLAFAAGAAAGYAWEHRARRAEVAELRADIARREAAAAREAYRRLELAQAAADRALAERDRRLADLDATHRRLRHALARKHDPRPCLDADTRELLHQSPAFGPGVSEASGAAARADAAPAAHPGERAASTDADLARWILDAAALYEACRARIEALRRWDEATHGR